MNCPSLKVRPLFRLQSVVYRVNHVRNKSGIDPIAEKLKNLRNGEPVKRWEQLAMFGAFGTILYWLAFTRHWEWEMDGSPGGMIGHSLGKYYYRKPIADQIKEQKRKDYEAGFDWKIKIFQE